MGCYCQYGFFLIDKFTFYTPTSFCEYPCGKRRQPIWPLTRNTAPYDDFTGWLRMVIRVRGFCHYYYAQLLFYIGFYVGLALGPYILVSYIGMALLAGCFQYYIGLRTFFFCFVPQYCLMKKHIRLRLH